MRCAPPRIPGAASLFPPRIPGAAHAKPWHLVEGHILTEINGDFSVLKQHSDRTKENDKTGLVMHKLGPLQFKRAFTWEKQNTP